jgi:hypothetical protein
VVRFDRVNPWTEAANVVYAARANAIRREGRWFRVSSTVADALEHPHVGTSASLIIGILAGGVGVLVLGIGVWFGLTRRSSAQRRQREAQA